jgi:molybdopterin/thiamine biosynthesis adenylyltransferase
MDRYRRQKAFQPIGELGQSRIAMSKVGICGVGALGSAVAERLCRAGVGTLVLIDRDWVEWDNLPRQTLFTEKDAEEVTPKSVAIQRHLHAINSQVVLESYVCDVHADSISKLFAGCHLIVDGTDNFETRFLINDFCCQTNTPWVHAGIVGASGQSMTIIPGRTACFRCLVPEPPPAEQMQTCDSAGVIGPAVGLIANWQAIEVLKYLVAGPEAIDGALRTFDLWHGEIRKLTIRRQFPSDSRPGCRACVQRKFDFLSGDIGTHAKAMCGRNSVQINTTRSSMDLKALAERLAQECEVSENSYMLKFELDGMSWTVFHDGRAIIRGTENVEEARKLYARRIGA